MSEPPAIKAIETEYGGCRFRSRLEARWAVAFDFLKVEWEYEPEGLDIDGTRYLPDFRLPAQNLFVEVKGVASANCMKKVVALAAAGQCGVLVLGSVPKPTDEGPFFYLFSHTILAPRVVQRWSVSIYPSDASGGFNPAPFNWPVQLGVDNATANTYERLAQDANETSQIGGFLPLSYVVADAFRAARSARFEFGECG